MKIEVTRKSITISINDKLVKWLVRLISFHFVFAAYSPVIIQFIQTHQAMIPFIH